MTAWEFPLFYLPTAINDGNEHLKYINNYIFDILVRWEAYSPSATSGLRQFSTLELYVSDFIKPNIKFTMRFGPIKLPYPRHVLLKCLYQVGKVSGHVFVC
jgi:hypothetical protein